MASGSDTYNPYKFIRVSYMSWNTSPNELQKFGGRFGKVVRLYWNYGPNKNQGVIEFDHHDEASRMLNAYSGRACEMLGKTVELQLLSSKDILKRVSPSSFLLVTTEGNYAVSTHVLHKMVSAFGFEFTIRTDKEADVFPALVVFEDSETADSLMNALDGIPIPKDLIPGLGPCYLTIKFVAPADVSEKFQSYRSRDYTEPMPTIHASGQLSLGRGGRNIEYVSNVLIVSIENMKHPVSLYVLHETFKMHGVIMKIAMFDKNEKVQALIQYYDHQSAERAKDQLEGHCIHDGVYCRLRISYSTLNSISIRGNNDWGRDYTMRPANRMDYALPSSFWQPPPAPPRNNNAGHQLINANAADGDVY